MSKKGVGSIFWMAFLRLISGNMIGLLDKLNCETLMIDIDFDDAALLESLRGMFQSRVKEFECFYPPSLDYTILSNYDGQGRYTHGI